jgi:hypothetical protein
MAVSKFTGGFKGITTANGEGCVVLLNASRKGMKEYQYLFFVCRHISLGVVTRLRARQPSKIMLQNPADARDFSGLQSVVTGFAADSNVLFIEDLGLFLRG